jgi:hypothetical protein
MRGTKLQGIIEKGGYQTILFGKPPQFFYKNLRIPSALAGSRSWGKFDQKLFKGYNN